MTKPPERIRVGENVTIYPRGTKQIWCADFWRNDQHCRQSLKTRNKKVALQRATKLSVDVAEGVFAKPPSQVTAAKAAADYIAFLKTKDRAQRTLGKYQANLDTFVTFLATLRVTALGQVSEVHFDKFRAARLQRLHPKTVYGESVVVKQMMKWAKKRKLIRENPLAEYELEKPEHHEGACPTLEQVNLLLAACDGVRQDLFSLLAFLGIRSGELCRLKPEDIDLTGNWVHVRSRPGAATKNRKSRKIPIPARLLPVLQRARRTGPWLFTEPASNRYPNGDHHLNAKRLNENFQKVAKKLEMSVGRKKRGFVLHSLRHFFETACVNAGIPQRAVDNWMGHAPDRSMGSIYYTLNDDESQGFMKRVPFEAKPA